MSKKPVLLCIMDGFGWTPNETYGNAVVAAKKPFLDSLMAKYPMTTIEASGMAVGLPDSSWLVVRTWVCLTDRWATLRWVTPIWAPAASSTSS